MQQLPNHFKSVTVLFENHKWSIERYFVEATIGEGYRIAVMDKKGASHFPLLTTKNELVYERPEAIPLYIKVKALHLARSLNVAPPKYFPNGFSEWMETHHEIVSYLTDTEKLPMAMSFLRHESQGKGGMYELGEELTDEFEKMHEGKFWDGDFLDAIDAFLLSKEPSYKG